MEHYYTDGTEPTILRQPRIPLGCDQQGRYPQASTELGLEEPEDDMLKVVLVDVLISMVALAVLAVTVLLLAGRL